LPYGIPIAPAVGGGGIYYQGRRGGAAAFFGGGPGVVLTNPFGPNPFNPFVFMPSIIPMTPAISDARVTVQMIQPVQIIGPRNPLLGGPPFNDLDIAGVDLDLLPDKKPPLAEVKKPAPPIAKVEKKPAKVEPPANDNARLTDLGLDAFSVKQFGLAALRFRQAIDADPTVARAHFLLAQAAMAVGNYPDALQAVEAGLRRNALWPRAPFQPRVELYQGLEADFADHFKRLQNALTQAPDNATFLFLTAYMLWFDGRRPEAVRLFQQARPRVRDATLVDLFLRVEAAAAK
jgi:hypothetical protein